MGKADAILIRSQDHAALIDAGKFDAADTVADYLLRHKVTALDYLIMSHPDSDHIGGMPGVLGEISVGAFVQADTGYFSEEGSGLSALLSMLEQNGTDTMSMEPGDSFTMGQAVFTAIGPMGSFEDPNNSSLVLRMDCRDFSALFCGDMEYDAEQALILSGQDIDIDLLKVGHHGSSTSSSLRFLWETSPKYAAISTALRTEICWPGTRFWNVLRILARRYTARIRTEILCLYTMGAACGSDWIRRSVQIMKQLSIDRFEGKFAICEDSEEKYYAIETSELPEGAKEGDVLRITDEGELLIDEGETRARRERIAAKQRRAFGK